MEVQSNEGSGNMTQYEPRATELAYNAYFETSAKERQKIRDELTDLLYSYLYKKALLFSKSGKIQMPEEVLKDFFNTWVDMRIRRDTSEDQKMSEAEDEPKKSQKNYLVSYQDYLDKHGNMKLFTSYVCVKMYWDMKREMNVQRKSKELLVVENDDEKTLDFWDKYYSDSVFTNNKRYGMPGETATKDYESFMKDYLEIYTDYLTNVNAIDTEKTVGKGPSQDLFGCLVDRSVDEVKLTLYHMYFMYMSVGLPVIKDKWVQNLKDQNNNERKIYEKQSDIEAMNKSLEIIARKQIRMDLEEEKPLGSMCQTLNEKYDRFFSDAFEYVSLKPLDLRGLGISRDKYTEGLSERIGKRNIGNVRLITKDINRDDIRAWIVTVDNKTRQKQFHYYQDFKKASKNLHKRFVEGEYDE